MFVKRLFFVSICIALLQTSYGQVSFNYGPELGITTPHFPIHRNTLVEGDESNETFSPVVSPLFGFHTFFSLKSHLRLSAGLQYQMTGTNYHSHRDGSIPRDNGIPTFYTYTYDTWENQHFHKIAIPLTAGYTFAISRFNTTVFGGIRPNIYLSGSYTYNSEYNASDNPENILSENNYNPLNKMEIASPMAHVQHQLLCGIATEIGPRFRIAVQYNRGPEINYAEHSASASNQQDFIEMVNQDFALSITYLLADIVKVAR